MIIVIKTKNIVITIFIFTCIFDRGNNDKKLIINSLFKTSIYIFFLTAIRHTRFAYICIIGSPEQILKI